MRKKIVSFILAFALLISVMGFIPIQVNAAEATKLDDLWPNTENLLQVCTKMSNGTNNDGSADNLASRNYMDPLKGCIRLVPGVWTRYWGPIVRTKVDYNDGMTQVVKIKWIDQGTEDNVYVLTLFPGLPQENGVNDLGYPPTDWVVGNELHTKFMKSYTAGDLNKMQKDKDGFITIVNVIKKDDFYSKSGQQPDGTLDLRIDVSAPGTVYEGEMKTLAQSGFGSYADLIKGYVEVYSAAVYKGDQSAMESPMGAADLSLASKGKEVKVELTNKDNYTCADNTEIKTTELTRTQLGNATAKCITGLKNGSVIALNNKIDFNNGLLDGYFTTAGNKQGGWVITGGEGDPTGTPGVTGSDTGAVWTDQGGKALTNKIEMLVDGKVAAVVYSDGSMPNRLTNNYSGFTGDQLQYIPGPALKTIVTNYGKTLKGEQSVSLKFYMDGMETYPGDFTLLTSNDPIEVTDVIDNSTGAPSATTDNQLRVTPTPGGGGGLSTPVLIIIIVAAVVVIGAGIGIVVVKGKKK